MIVTGGPAFYPSTHQISPAKVDAMLCECDDGERDDEQQSLLASLQSRAAAASRSLHFSVWANH